MVAKNHVRVETVPDAHIQDATDAIVRVTASSIGGSDLHVYNGLLSNKRIGQELVGLVEDVGPLVKKLKKGDKVVVPFPIACGACWFCKHDMLVHCDQAKQDGGAQADAVRVPYADYGPRRVDLPDEKVLLVTDTLAAGWAAMEWARLKGGETVVVLGCGPVGIMAMKSAWLRGAGRVIGVDVEAYRCGAAKAAAKAETVCSREPVSMLRELTHGRGADVCVDAVGMNSSDSIEVLEHCIEAVRRGGMVAVVGVYNKSYDNFLLAQIYDKGIRMAHGQAPVHRYLDYLLDLVASEKLVLDDVITHQLPLAQAPQAYETLAAKKDNCVKVMLKP